MNTTTNKARVELYNLWERGCKFPANGYYVFEVLPSGARGRLLKNYGRDQIAARLYAAHVNGRA